MIKFLQYLQEKVVFLPIKLAKDYTYQFPQKFEELFFKTPNQGKINALFFRVKSPKGVILYFHGNADNLNRWGKIAGEFTKYGYDILVADYRGYGKSSGPRNEEFLFGDAQYCYDYLKKYFSEDNIIVYGRSLGGAFATKIASENLPKKVILEATFFNLQDMASRWIPYSFTEKVRPRMVYHFRSNELISKIKVPLYHFHGDKDFVVPIKSGKKLFETFKNSNPDIPQKFIEIKGGSHDDLVKFELFQTEMKKILD